MLLFDNFLENIFFVSEYIVKVNKNLLNKIILVLLKKLLTIQILYATKSETKNIGKESSYKNPAKIILSAYKIWEK